MTFQHNGIDGGVVAGSASCCRQGCASYKILWCAPIRALSRRAVAIALLSKLPPVGARLASGIRNSA